MNKQIEPTAIANSCKWRLINLVNNMRYGKIDFPNDKSCIITFHSFNKNIPDISYIIPRKAIRKYKNSTLTQQYREDIR